MYLHGQFKTLNDTATIYVYIWNNIGTDNIEIDGINSEVFFTSDPLHITASDDGLDSPIISKKCTIRVTAKDWLGNRLFSPEPRKTSVLIQEKLNSTTQTIFYGFVEPSTYNQDYSSVYNEIQINCIDLLGLLEYELFLNNNWTTAVNTATINSFKNIINTIIPYAGQTNLPDPTGNITLKRDICYIYNAGKSCYSNFNKKVNELTLLGDEDEHSNKYDALSKILTYLGYKIVQDEHIIYIYDPAQFMTTNTKYKKSLIISNDPSRVYSPNIGNTTLIEGYVDEQYDITTDEIYSKLMVSVDREDTDEVFPDLFSNDNNTSPYTARTHYMKEFCQPANTYNLTHFNKFRSMINNEALPSGTNGWLRDWYFRYMENPAWTFYTRYNGTRVKCSDITYTSQNDHMRIHGTNAYAMPMQCNIANEQKITNSNKTINSELTEKEYVAISINGNGTLTGNDSHPNFSEANDMQGMIICNSTDVNYTPSDNDTTYYILFSGKLRFEPRTRTSWKRENTHFGGGDSSLQYNTTWNTIKTEINDTFQTWKYQWTPSYNGWNTTTKTYYETYSFLGGVIPYEDPNQCYYAQKYDGFPDTFPTSPILENNALQSLPYKGTFDSSDNKEIYKLSVLNCSLRIGNKYLSETFELGSDNIYRSKWEWTTNSSATFTLGIQPEKDSKVIGISYEFQNTVTADMNIDGKGTAIPMTREDGLSGDVEFKIFGLVDNVYDNNNYKIYRNIGAATSSGNRYHLLPRCRTLWIESFNIALKSDNAKTQQLNTKDLVYMSANNPSYVRNPLEIEYEICSALTQQQANELEVENGIYTNLVYNDDDTPCTEIKGYDNTNRRAEEDFIVKYYDWVSQPRNIYKFKIPAHKENISYNNIKQGYWLTKPAFTTYDDGVTSNTRISLMKSIDYDVKNQYIEIEGYIN